MQLITALVLFLAQLHSSLAQVCLCPKLYIPNGATVTVDSSRTVNSTVSIACNAGYSVAGTIPYMCVKADGASRPFWRGDQSCTETSLMNERIAVSVWIGVGVLAGLVAVMTTTAIWAYCKQAAQKKALADAHFRRSSIFGHEKLLASVQSQTLLLDESRRGSRNTISSGLASSESNSSIPSSVSYPPGIARSISTLSFKPQQGSSDSSALPSSFLPGDAKAASRGNRTPGSPDAVRHTWSMPQISEEQPATVPSAPPATPAVISHPSRYVTLFRPNDPNGLNGLNGRNDCYLDLSPRQQTSIPNEEPSVHVETPSRKLRTDPYSVPFDEVICKALFQSLQTVDPRHKRLARTTSLPFIDIDQPDELPSGSRPPSVMAPPKPKRLQRFQTDTDLLRNSVTEGPKHSKAQEGQPTERSSRQSIQGPKYSRPQRRQSVDESLGQSIHGPKYSKPHRRQSVEDSTHQSVQGPKSGDSETPQSGVESSCHPVLGPKYSKPQRCQSVEESLRQSIHGPKYSKPKRRPSVEGQSFGQSIPGQEFGDSYRPQPGVESWRQSVQGPKYSKPQRRPPVEEQSLDRTSQGPKYSKPQKRRSVEESSGQSSQDAKYSKPQRRPPVEEESLGQSAHIAAYNKSQIQQAIESLSQSIPGLAHSKSLRHLPRGQSLHQSAYDPKYREPRRCPPRVESLRQSVQGPSKPQRRQPVEDSLDQSVQGQKYSKNLKQRALEESLSQSTQGAAYSKSQRHRSAEQSASQPAQDPKQSEAHKCRTVKASHRRGQSLSNLSQITEDRQILC